MSYIYIYIYDISSLRDKFIVGSVIFLFLSQSRSVLMPVVDVLLSLVGCTSE